MPEGLNKIENNELEMTFNSSWNNYDLDKSMASEQINQLLEKKFPGVSQSSKDVYHPDPNPTIGVGGIEDKDDTENGVTRKLKFKDINQKNEFLRLIEILKRSDDNEEKAKILKEINFYE